MKRLIRFPATWEYSGEFSIQAFMQEGLDRCGSAHPMALKVVQKDPDDNKFIECAVALKANAVISGDKALREVKNYMGIKIYTLAEFLNYYGSKPEDTE